MTTTQDVLPPWLRLLYTAMSEYPSEKGIKINGQVLVSATGVFIAIASMADSDISEGVLAVWLSAPLIMMGLGNWVQSIKRSTPQSIPPGQPAAEDLAATQGTPAPKPVLTKADAQKAADALEARQRDLRATSVVEGEGD